MKNLNLDRLINSSIDDVIKNLDSIFKNLIQEIELYLKIEPIDY